MDLEKIKSEISKLFEGKDLFLYSVDFNDNILEVVFDKHGFVDSDEIIAATKVVNDYLDKADPIENEYSLSVTSRGADKEISFDEAEYYLKESVVVRTFEQVMNGELVEKGNDYIVIKDKKNKKIKIKANDITCINIAIVF